MLSSLNLELTVHPAPVYAFMQLFYAKFPKFQKKFVAPLCSRHPR